VGDTREKLLEAKYFLERMIETQSGRDPFKYNLSAFLAAARSVTLIMQKEFAKVSGFKKWWAEQQVRLQSDDAMRLLNAKRVMTIHTQPVRPRAHINVGITEHIAFSGSLSITVTHADGTVEHGGSELTPPPSTPAKTEVTSEWLWYFDELPEKDVIAICEEHVTKLGKLVAECEAQL